LKGEGEEKGQDMISRRSPVALDAAKKRVGLSQKKGESGLTTKGREVREIMAAKEKEGGRLVLSQER